MAKPSVTQAYYILRIAGLVGAFDVNYNQAAINVCAFNDWIERCDEGPFFHRATDTGIEAAKPLVPKILRAHRINIIKKNVARLTDDELAQVAALIDRHTR